MHCTTSYMYICLCIEIHNQSCFKLPTIWACICHCVLCNMKTLMGVGCWILSLLPLDNNIKWRPTNYNGTWCNMPYCWICFVTKHPSIPGLNKWPVKLKWQWAHTLQVLLFTLFPVHSTPSL